MKLFEFLILCIFGFLGLWVFLGNQNSKESADCVKIKAFGKKVATDSLDDNSADGSTADFEKTKKHYEDTREKRLNLFRKLYQGKTAKGWEWGDLYNGLVPEVFCLSLVRIGAVSDGGKWVCNPWKMPNNCAIYSLGVNEDTSFERELQAMTDVRCKIYAYDKLDPTNQSVLDGMEKLNFFFKKALIGTSDNPKKNMVDIKTEMAAHKDERIEILKIDIEGSEMTVLRELIKATKICQILVEIHGKGGGQVVKLLNDLGQKGYRLFSYEINGKHHSLSEYSLIHDDCLERYRAEPLAFYLNQAHSLSVDF